MDAPAVEAWLANEAVANGDDVALVDDVVQAQLEATEDAGKDDVELGVGYAVFCGGMGQRVFVDV